jgi:hypothetical protein
MPRYPHMHVSLAAGPGYVMIHVGDYGQSTQIAVSAAEARAIADALRLEADAAAEKVARV